MTRRVLLLALAPLCATGCLLPATRLDAGALESRGEGKSPPSPAAFRVQPIDPKLIEAQAITSSQVRRAALPDPNAALAASYEYRIAPHDVLTVIVYDHPELTIPAGQYRAAENTGYPVSSEGYVSFPYVGRFKVGGLTLEEARRALTDRLSTVVHFPQIQVLVASYRGKRFQVSGEVLGAGTFPITDVPVRVQDALGLARGPGPEADLRHVVLSRNGQRFVLDVQALQELGDQSPNWLLQDGDVLHVPDRSRNRVFVVGEVRLPQTRQMVKGRMTLAEALSDVGWLDPLAANPAQIFVLRGTYEAPEVYRLDASRADAMLLATRFRLRPRDVVFVATSGIARWNRSLAQIMPTVQTIWQSYDILYRSTR
ncbi:polysaccharide biosynthesis/export family protein [Anaeromyxobacter paludicola]|uniref:Exopolysaccharide biosynthesis protein BceE n=1 Tax=Anaeromyxobacter paludicola TaxID=2918171 RepID=A0ABM7X9K3_9BACT|nr:polysaccharide biosynthesis/export family protein [Anaeromyxobacter paludicola]BDG08512.1 exopolysaccharide biosynthesis protein BceE [Anaeromyxobacter paludicola]